MDGLSFATNTRKGQGMRKTAIHAVDFKTLAKLHDQARERDYARLKIRVLEQATVIQVLGERLVHAQLAAV